MYIETNFDCMLDYSIPTVIPTAIINCRYIFFLICTVRF